MGAQARFDAGARFACRSRPRLYRYWSHTRAGKAPARTRRLPSEEASMTLTRQAASFAVIGLLALAGAATSCGSSGSPPAQQSQAGGDDAGDDATTATGIGAPCSE